MSKAKIPAALSLATCTDLPNEFCVILADFPRDSWPGHRDFNGLAAFWLDRHLSDEEDLVLPVVLKHRVLKGGVSDRSENASVERFSVRWLEPERRRPRGSPQAIGCRNLAAPGWGWRGNAPARGQAGAVKFDSNQIWQRKRKTAGVQKSPRPPDTSARSPSAHAGGFRFHRR